MKRCIKSAKELTYNNKLGTTPWLANEENRTEELSPDHDFDERWDNKFGEPSTEVFEADDFKRWMQEVIDFE